MRETSGPAGSRRAAEGEHRPGTAGTMGEPAAPLRRSGGARPGLPWRWLAAAAAALATLPAHGLGPPETPSPGAVPGGRELYRTACAACHGADGAGLPRGRVGFEEPLPDFTDCGFATREPDADWIAVAHEGGPVRGFAPMMPAFGDALTTEELQRILDHVRSFCADRSWPRGELNLPRPLVTEKAYPEDEAVFTTAVAAEGRGSVASELVYEKRFGARNQIEIAVPFSWREREAAPGGGDGGDGWTGGVGDLAVGVKRAVYHRLERGSILSFAGEVILPTGDEEEGLGKGTAVIEPFVAFGQILAAEAFLHLQAGIEIPVDEEKGEEEAFWRLALGRSLTRGRFGRTFSPMVEVLGKRELAGGAEVQWDVIPQLQVTLNTRQHVMASLGVRLPAEDGGDREAEVIAYLLWDWFDGGFLAGW